MRRMSLLLTLLAITAPMSVQAQAPATSNEFRVDSDASWLRVLAYPDGPLARFGHNHVISHNGISGVVDVASDALESSIEGFVGRITWRIMRPCANGDSDPSCRQAHIYLPPPPP